MAWIHNIEKDKRQKRVRSLRKSIRLTEKRLSTKADRDLSERRMLLKKELDTLLS